MKKVNWGKLILVLFLLLFVGIIANIVMAFYGSPVTKIYATWQIRDYVEKTYPDMNLEVPKAGYNFKFGEYVSHVQSPTSADTKFSVSWKKGEIYDYYEMDVLKRDTTYRRLQEELSNIVEEAISREFPYQTSIVFADAVKSTGDFSMLTLDMPLDTMTVPLPTSLVVYYYHEQLDYDVFSKILIELSDIMNRNNIRIDYYSVVMEETPEEGEKPTSGDKIHLFDFPAEKIVSDNLAEDIKMHMEVWESEHEK